MVNQRLFLGIFGVGLWAILGWGCNSHTSLVAQRLLAPQSITKQESLAVPPTNTQNIETPLVSTVPLTDSFSVPSSEPVAFTPPQTSPIEPNVQPLPEVMKPDLTVTQKDQVTPNVPLPKGPPISQVTFVDEKTQQPITVGLGAERASPLPIPSALPFSVLNYMSNYYALESPTSARLMPYDPAYSYSGGTLPASKDLRIDMPPIRIQGDRNTCVFFAWAGVVGYFEKRAGLFTGGGVSPGFLSWLYQDEIKGYATNINTNRIEEFSSISFVGNLLDSNTPADMYYGYNPNSITSEFPPRTATFNQGMVSEDQFPYALFAPPAPSAISTNRQQNLLLFSPNAPVGLLQNNSVPVRKVRTYQIAKPDGNTAAYLNNLKAALNSNHPVIVGISLGDLSATTTADYLNWGIWNKTALNNAVILNLPTRDTGGHAIVLVGYEDNAAGQGGGYFIMRNSWGDTQGNMWGFQGYAKIPYQYILNFSDSPSTADLVPTNATRSVFGIRNTRTQVTVNVRPLTLESAANNIYGAVQLPAGTQYVRTVIQGGPLADPIENQTPVRSSGGVIRDQRFHVLPLAANQTYTVVVQALGSNNQVLKAGVQQVTTLTEGNTATADITLVDPVTVTLTPPTPASQTVGSTLTLAATLAPTANNGVAKVDFYAGSEVVGSDTTAPYQAAWNTTSKAAGTYQLKAVARNAQNLPLAESAVAQVQLTAAVTLPTMTWFSPAAGISKSIGGNETISLQAAIPTSVVGATRVEFYGNNSFLGSANASNNLSPFYMWNLNNPALPLGAYTLRAKALSAQNQVVAESPARQITLTAPLMQLTAPAHNSVFVIGQPIELQATSNLTAGTPIAQVNFYSSTGSQVLGSVVTAPYRFTWNTTGKPAMTYGISAQAVNAQNVILGQSNARASSPYVNITLIAPPTVTLTSPAANQSQTIGAIINLAATVTPTTHVNRVEFYNGATLLGTSTTAPYQFAWNTSGTPSGNYNLKAVVKGAQGQTFVESVVVTGQLTGTVPATPQAPQWNQDTSRLNTLRFSWPVAAGATSYNLYRKTGTAGTYELYQGGIVGTSVDTNFGTWPAPATYYLALKAVNGAGESGFSSASQGISLQNSTTTQANTLLVFTSSRDGNDEIYTMKPDGTSPQRRTINTAIDTRPKWHPNRGSVIFTSYRDGNAELYYLRLSDNGAFRMTNNSATDDGPVWAPSGDHVLHHSNRGTDGLFKIYKLTFPRASNGGLQITSGTSQALTSGPGHDKFPSYSPDGTNVVFQSTRGGTNNDLYVMNANGTNVLNITNSPTIDETTPSWSPRGDRIAYQANGDIYTALADGTAPTRVTSNAAIEGQPSWSFDGSRILYVSTQHGTDELYSIKPDGTEAQRLTNNTFADNYPNWSP